MWVSLYPLRCQILHNSRVSVTIARLTYLVENLVVGGHAETVTPGAMSSRSPRNLSLFADFAISVFWEMSKHMMLT